MIRKDIKFSLLSDGSRAWLVQGTDAQINEFNKKLLKFLGVEEVLVFDIDWLPDIPEITSQIQVLEPTHNVSLN